MNTNDPRQVQVENIKVTLNGILSYDVNDLIKKDKLGEMSFEDLEEYFKVVMRYCAELKQTDKLIELSEAQLNSMQSGYLSPILSTIKQIKEFDWSKHENPKQVIANFKNTMKNNYNTFMDGMSKYHHLLITGTADNLQCEVAEVEEIKKEIANKSKEISKLLDDSKTTAGKLGVSEHTKVFAEQAEEHLKASKLWMAATVAIGVLTLVVAAWSLDWFMKDFEQLKVPGYAVQFVITKLVIFSILYFALVWASKNYRSNRHNYVVNKHRQNALSTFKTFVDAVKDDPKTENAILNKTTDCIFSHEITGYLPKEPETGPGVQQIFEILPKLTGKGE